MPRADRVKVLQNRSSTRRLIKNYEIPGRRQVGTIAPLLLGGAGLTAPPVSPLGVFERMQYLAAIGVQQPGRGTPSAQSSQVIDIFAD